MAQPPADNAVEIGCLLEGEIGWPMQSLLFAMVNHDLPKKEIP